MRTGTAEQLHWLDQTTINGDLETGLLLMERASRGLTDVALQYLETEAEEGEQPWAAVFCGTGNNGGDEDVAGNGDQPTSSSSQAGKPATATSAATGDAPRAIASLALGAAAAAAAAAFAHKRQRMARGKHCR